MPLIDDNGQEIDKPTLAPEVQQRFSTANPEPVGLFQQMGAAFRSENTIGILATRPDALPDANLPEQDPLAAELFHPEDYLTEDEKLRYPGAFSDANSIRDVEAIRKQIENEEQAKRSMADGPLPSFVAGLVAGGADPLMWLPVTGPLARVGRLAGAAEGAALGAAGGAAYETIRRGAQRTRTSEESAASIVTGLALGGVIGGVLAKGAARGLSREAAEVARPAIEGEITNTFRAAGLGDMPIPRGGLLDTTAVGRFLSQDVQPRLSLQVGDSQLAERDILDHIASEKPHLVDNVTKHMSDVEALQDRISRLEADPTLFSRAPSIRDKATLDLLEHLDKSTVPADLEQATAIREAAQPANVLDRLYRQMDEATANWQAAEDALQAQIKKVRDAFKEVGQGLGPKEMAQANADIASHYDALKAALAEGRDPLKTNPTPNPLDWLQGIAQYPRNLEKLPEGEASTAKAFEPKLPESLSSAASGNAPENTANRLRGALGMAKISAKLKKAGLAAPGIELAMSRFETARRVIQFLANTGMTTEGHWLGVRGPDDLATEVKILGTPHMIRLERVLGAAWSDFKAFQKANPEVPRMTKREFLEAIGEAMTRGDKHPNEIIQKAAEMLRPIEDELKKLAIENKVGVFKNPESAEAKLAKTAPSHLQRVWHHEKMRADFPGFKALAKDWFVRTHKGGPAELTDLADDIAEKIYHEILGSPEGRLTPEIKVSEGRGSAKERTFEIPDNWTTLDGKYSTAQFVDRNVANVMARYIKTMASDIAYKKIMEGDEGMQQIMESFRAEAASMIEALAPKRDEALSALLKKDLPPDELEKAAAKLDTKMGKQQAAIWKEMLREMRVVSDLTNRIRGIDPHPVDPSYQGLKTVLRTARDYNVIRVMGSSLMSQLPDLGAMAMSEGAGRVFGSIIGDFLDGFKTIKIGKEMAQKLGTAEDMMLGGRYGQLADITEQYVRQNRFSEVSGVAAHKALVLFGIAPWTVAAKARASYLGSDSILTMAEKLAEGGKLSDANKARLAAIGIDKEMATRFVAERENWFESRGFKLPQVEQWKDIEAANAFRRALLRRIDNSVLTPSAADRPLWTQTEIGKVLQQFQAFGWAAHNRILIAGLQYRDYQAISGMMTMIGMGMLSRAMLDIVSNGKIDDKRNVGGWIREGIDRSGVLARFMEYDNIWDKASGGMGIARFLSGQEAQRYQGQGLVERLAGPTGSGLSDLSKALSNTITGDFTGADLHSLRRVLPLQNYFLTRHSMDNLENSLVTSYGLSPRRQAQ